MDPSDVAVVILTVLIGVGSGILSALLGVGGAVITTPAVRVLGATPIQAVGSTVPAILPSAISGTLRYAREGLVDWQAALGLGIAGALFAVGGALVSDLVDGRVLMLFTAVLMLWSGLSVVRGGRRNVPARAPALGPGPDSEPEPEPEPEQRVGHPLALLGALGAVSGFVAGLLGVGGGIIMVPVLTGPLKVPMKSAVASSLVAVAIFSVPALVTHWVLGHINWAFALPLMLGVVPGARIGAHLSIASSERTIRLLFGVLIIVLAIVYGVSEATALF